MRRLLLSMILLELPLQYDKNFFHQEDIATFGSIAGLNVSITTLCLAALYLQWVLKALGHRNLNPRRKLHLRLPPLVYLGCVSLSILWADDRALSVFEMNLLFQAFLLYFYIANTVRTRSDLEFILVFLLIGVSFQGALMGLLSVGGEGITLLGAVQVRYDEISGRTAGTLGSVVLAGSYFGLLLPLALSVLVSAAHARLRMLALIGLAAGVYGVILTQSRGAWIAAAFSCTMLLLCAAIRGWLPKKTVFVAGVVSVCLLLAFQGLIVERITGDDDNSAYSRIPLIKMALQMIGERPFLGVGANNCATVALGDYAGRPGFRGEWFYTIHNKYLLTWVETGALGLLAFCVFLLHTIHLAWKTWRHKDRMLAMLGLGCGLAIAGQMIHMSVDVFNSRPQVQMLWLVAGMITAIDGFDDAG